MIAAGSNNLGLQERQQLSMLDGICLVDCLPPLKRDAHERDDVPVFTDASPILLVGDFSPHDIEDHVLTGLTVIWHYADCRVDNGKQPVNIINRQMALELVAEDSSKDPRAAFIQTEGFKASHESADA